MCCVFVSRGEQGPVAKSGVSPATGLSCGLWLWRPLLEATMSSIPGCPTGLVCPHLHGSPHPLSCTVLLLGQATCLGLGCGQLSWAGVLQWGPGPSHGTGRPGQAPLWEQAT